MDPLDAFPPIPSGPVPQSPTARVERADPDAQRERARDDEPSDAQDEEQKFEEELEDAYEQHASDEPPGRRARPVGGEDAQAGHGQTPTRPPPRADRREGQDSSDGPGEDESGQHIDISV